MQHSPGQSGAIDTLKAGASQLIVLHHLAAYGPISDALETSAPALVDWLFDYGRMAVQVFLVIGGYLAARAFSSGAAAVAGFPGRAIAQRYLRLAVPYLVALVLAIVAATLARQWLDADFVPSAPQARQVLAHALLLHQWLGYESLSAGAWYVAIDLQLFATLAILLWLGRSLRSTGAARGATSRPGTLSLVLVGVCAVASLFWFNRNAGLDDWAIYFFAAYAMGASVYWAGTTRHGGRWLLAMTALVAFALLIEFRWRLAIALATALTLAWAQRGEPVSWVGERLSRAAGRISYALFLVHFPVVLLFNALFARLGSDRAGAGLVLAACAWVTAVALAIVFQRWVESPLASLYQGRRTARS